MFLGEFRKRLWVTILDVLIWVLGLILDGVFELYSNAKLRRAKLANEIFALVEEKAARAKLED